MLLHVSGHICSAMSQKKHIDFFRENNDIYHFLKTARDNFRPPNI